MAGGNPNKVNAIVDEIVKNNNLFKLKSPIEQDKEKDSIAKSINSALSVLNEVGKELVLQELSVDPDEKFKGFIDSVGNVDISGLSQMTATIVKEKIIEAEKEGIDLRQGQPLFKDNTKSLLVEGVFTVAVIDTMIRDYDKLSANDKDSLAKNWNNMSPKQKREYSTALGSALEKKSKSIKDKKIKEQISDVAKKVKQMPENEEQYSRELDNMSDVQLQEYIESIYGKDSPICKLTSEKQREKAKNDFRETNKSVIIGVQEYESSPNIEDTKKLDNSQIDSNCNQYRLLGISNEIPISMKDFKKKTIVEQNIILRYVKEKLNTSISLENFLKQEKVKVVEHENENLDEKISQENEQLFDKLKEEGFSQEEIKESLIQYKTLMEQLPEKYISKLENASPEDVPNMLNIILTKKGNIKPEISEILSKVNYDGQLLTILRDESKRKEFIEQLDQVIELKKEQQPIQDEHTDEYYRSQNETLKVDGDVEKIAQEVQARGGSVEEITKALADTVIKHESKPVTQTQSEMYSFIDAEYLKQDSIEGLIPRNGENSQSSQDDKKAIFYSQGKEGAIVMYFEFLKQYERLKGSDGDKALEQYASYKNGTIELSDEQVQLLQGQLKQITQMRETKDFNEFMGDKLYLKLNGIDAEQDRQAAEEWRASHPGTRMHYNYANSWTNNAISPDRIDVVSLQSKDGKDVRTSQKDLIKYFLSQTSIDKIEELGVNDTTLENIRKYYQEHSAEIAQMGEEYSVVTQNIQEFEQSRENSDFEKQVIEQEKNEETSQNMAMVEQDNSFIGKIKRVFANMKDMKNKDNSKGFFARLGASIQTVFGNKKEEFYTEQDEISTYAKTEDKIQPRTNPKQIDYLNQHFEVNTQEAIRKTEESKKSKEFLSTEDKTADKEEK